MTNTTGSSGAMYTLSAREDRETVTGARIFVAEDPRYPGVIGYGDTAAEAFDMFERARVLTGQSALGPNERIVQGVRITGDVYASVAA
jgi:hypothetical protein